MESGGNLNPHSRHYGMNIGNYDYLISIVYRILDRINILPSFCSLSHINNENFAFLVYNSTFVSFLAYIYRNCPNDMTFYIYASYNLGLCHIADHI